MHKKLYHKRDLEKNKLVVSDSKINFTLNFSNFQYFRSSLNWQFGIWPRFFVPFKIHHCHMGHNNLSSNHFYAFSKHLELLPKPNFFSSFRNNAFLHQFGVIQFANWSKILLQEIKYWKLQTLNNLTNPFLVSILLKSSV